MHDPRFYSFAFLRSSSVFKFYLFVNSYVFFQMILSRCYIHKYLISIYSLAQGIAFLYYFWNSLLVIVSNEHVWSICYIYMCFFVIPFFRRRTGRYFITYFFWCMLCMKLFIYIHIFDTVSTRSIFLIIYAVSYRSVFQIL